VVWIALASAGAVVGVKGIGFGFFFTKNTNPNTLIKIGVFDIV
jgi:hypothetical protein